MPIEAIPEGCDVGVSKFIFADLLLNLLPSLKRRLVGLLWKKQALSREISVNEPLSFGPVPKGTECAKLFANRCRADITSPPGLIGASGDILLEFRLGDPTQNLATANQTHDVPHVDSERTQRGFLKRVVGD